MTVSSSQRYDMLSPHSCMWTTPGNSQPRRHSVYLFVSNGKPLGAFRTHALLQL